MRFPLGLLSQYIGHKNATLVEMGLIAVAISIPMVMMIVFAKEPDNLDKHASFKQHFACL